MKRVLILLFCLSSVVDARWHRGPPGPQGPAGPQGDPGIPGVSGAQGQQGDVGAVGATGQSIQGAPGKDGEDGQDGRDGNDALDATRLNVGAELIWFDEKRWALSSGYRYDLKHHGHTIDALILGIKIGDSYQDRQMKKLQNDIAEHNKLMLSQMKARDQQEQQTKTFTAVATPTGPEPEQAVIHGGSR